MRLLSFLFIAFVLFSGCGSDEKEFSDGDMDVAESENETTDGDVEAENSYEFEEFAYMDEEPDPSVRICKEASDPAAAEDKIFIDCLIEGESFADESVEAKDNITVMAYNIERGYHVDDQVDFLLNNPDSPEPDVIMISESDRGCSRTDGKVVIREFAEKLKMNYVYAVEFVELKEENGVITSRCEHGNGVLSKYPLGNVRAIRHTTQDSWYESEDEKRLGGRVAVYADVKIGDKYLHVYAVHLESSLSEDTRNAQAMDLINDASTKPFIAVLGGDFNAGFYMLDLDLGLNTDKTVKPFLENGYFDAHQSIDYLDRTTRPESGFILDFIFSNKDVFSSPEIGDLENWENLSDHLPVWAEVDLLVE